MHANASSVSQENYNNKKRYKQTMMGYELENWQFAMSRNGI